MKRWGRTKLWVALFGMALMALSGPLGLSVATCGYIASLAGGYIAAEGIADIRSRGTVNQPAGEKGAPE